MIVRLERMFLAGMFPVASALAGCDVEGVLPGVPPQDGGVGGTAPGGAGSGGTSGSLDAGLGGSAGGDEADSGAPFVATNLWADGSFETSDGGWLQVGNATLSRSTEVSRSGAASLHVGNRTMEWEGAGRDLLSSVTAGATYEVSAWVRLPSATAGSREISLTLLRRCPPDGEIGRFFPLMTTSVGAEWALLQGTFEAPACDLTSLMVFIETARLVEEMPNADYYVDDASLTVLP